MSKRARQRRRVMDSIVTVIHRERAVIPDKLVPVGPTGNIVNNITGGTYWYQFVRNDGTLTMNYGYDGVHYSTALSSPLAHPASTFNELLLTGTTYLTNNSFTDYA